MVFTPKNGSIWHWKCALLTQYGNICVYNIYIYVYIEYNLTISNLTPLSHRWPYAEERVKRDKYELLNPIFEGDALQNMGVCVYMHVENRCSLLVSRVHVMH